MKKSQTNRILNYILKGYRITPLGALKRFGCMRLASRITDIKKLGITIDRTMVKRNGKTFASYGVDKGIAKEYNN